MSESDRADKNEENYSTNLDLAQEQLESEALYHESETLHPQGEQLDSGSMGLDVQQVDYEEKSVFSYDQDNRLLRSSIKSDSDVELEDVSGNVDMVDNIREEVTTTEEPTRKQDHGQGDFADNEANCSVSNGNLNALNSVQEKAEEPLKDRSHKSSEEEQASIVNNQLTNKKGLEQIAVQARGFDSLSKVDSFGNEKNSESHENKSVNSPENTPQQKHEQSKIIGDSNSSIKTPQKSRMTLIKQRFQLFGSSSKKEELQSDCQESPLSTFDSTTVNNQYSQRAKNYKQEMEDDLAQLKSSFKNNQKNSKVIGANSASQKQKANKTQAPTKNKFYTNNNKEEIKSEDLKMLIKISFEKKKQNYNMLRQWDKRRADNMGLHRTMVELLQSQIDKRIKASLENLQIYTSFFREKVKQEEKFINSPVINTKYALQNNSVSKNIYINCSVILNSLSEENQQRCKRIQDFIHLIKQNILKDLTEHHLHQSQRELLRVREKISSLKNSLKKYNAEAEQKTKTLAAFFSESASNVSIRSDNDFYSVQLEFLKSAGQQIMIQKKLGENCLEYYRTALNEEIKRSAVIKEAMLTYAKGIKQTYAIELDEAQMEQLSKGEENKLIQEFYSIEDMFDERSLQVFKAKHQISAEKDLTERDFSKYVQKFEYENFNSRMLLLKEFQAKYYTAATKDSKSCREQICYIVITVDFFIHLFFACQKTSLSAKPDVTLKISPKEIDVREQKDQFIDIIKKEERRGSMMSYFWDNKNDKVYRVKFHSKDAREEFGDYVRKLMY